jgi:hypothetical protein
LDSLEMVRAKTSNSQEQTIKMLESEVSNIKLNLTNTVTTLGLVSKDLAELERTINLQKVQMDKLVKLNDSLISNFKGPQNQGFIINPTNEGDSIVFCIQSYLASKSWQDRLELVLNPEKVGPLMEEYYKDSYTAKLLGQEKISLQGEGYKANEVFKVVVSGDFFYCKKINSGYKIDWEASVGYNKVNLLAVKVQINPQPVKMRLALTLRDYYNYNFSSKEEIYLSILAEQSDGCSVSCFVERNTEEGKKIFELLKDGRSHEAIVELLIDKTDDKTGNIAIIRRLHQVGWSSE